MPELEGEHDSVWQEVCTYYHSALAPSTKKQYAAHVKYFATFCVAFGYDARCPSEETVMRYCAFQARSVAHSTVVQYLKGLKDFYKARGLVQFGCPVAWPHLFRVVKGIKRVHKRVAHQKAPITPAMLMQLREHLQRTLAFGAALWACCLLTFFGFFRKSNTTTEAATPWSTAKCITAEDVTVDEKRYALRIRLHETKTFQRGDKVLYVWIAGRPSHPLDPVAAWRQHVLTNSPELSGPAFVLTAQGGRKAITHEALESAAKYMARAAGVPDSEVSGHSFRRGGASYAALCGVSDILIQRQGDWRSLCYREYIVCPPETLLGASGGMLAAMSGDPRTWGAGLLVAAEPAGHAGMSAVFA